MLKLVILKVFNSPKAVNKQFPEMIKKEVDEPSVHLNALKPGLGKVEFHLVPGATL